MPTEPQDLVVEARELLSGLTPGQWRNERQVVADENSIVVGTETYNWRFVAHTNSDTDEAGEETPPISEKEAVANAELIARAPELLRQLADEVEKLRKQIKTIQRDAREDAQSAANEARWQERQGEDYGSY